MTRSLGWVCAATGFVVAATSVQADFGSIRVSADLRPRNEVPAVSSPASGKFVGIIHRSNDTLEYELSFENLQANVLQAHIHLAQPNVNGGIMVWLCGTANLPGPAGTPLCPQSGTVSGVITPASIQVISTQGIAALEFDEFVDALLSGLAYANVHTQQSPGGEIRGQVRRGAGHGNAHDD